MPFTYSRTGNTVTVTITQDVTDLVANTTATANDKINAALARCAAQLSSGMTGQAGGYTAEITALQAQQAALPVPIPGF